MSRGRLEGEAGVCIGCGTNVVFMPTVGKVMVVPGIAVDVAASTCTRARETERVSSSGRRYKRRGRGRSRG